MPRITEYIYLAEACFFILKSAFFTVGGGAERVVRSCSVAA